MSRLKESILYTIKDGDVLKGYILGTMHVRDKRAFSFLDKILALIDDCNKFYAETDLDALQKINISGSMSFDSGDHIKNYFTPKRYNKIDKLCIKSFQISLNEVGHLRPLAIINFLTLRLLSNDMNLPLDHHLWNYASQHKECLGLETAIEQRDIYKQIPFEWELKQFKDAMRNISSFRKGIAIMANYYQAGRVNKLYRVGRKQLGSMRSLLLYDRNVRMGNVAINALRLNTCFITVGAGHLAGKKGVLRIIKKAGYSISPVQLLNE